MPARLVMMVFARFLMVATIVALGSASARAEEAPPEPGMRLEWAGAELLPLSVNAGSAPSWATSPARFRAGLGGMLRVVRLRWANAYWTPVEAGVFVAGGASGDDAIVLAQVATEGGVRVPVGGGTFELGLAAGAGGLSIAYPGSCDGTCALGGVGPMLSPVARVLVRDASRWSVGFVLRAAVPLRVPHGEWIGHITGFGALVLGGVDVSFGS
jgi:hypothetical protein